MGIVKINFTDKSEQHSTEALLKELFFDTDNHKRILTELNNYHSDEDGAPLVSEFEVVEVTYNPDTLTGQVRFAYHVDFTFACADKLATTNHFETSDFTIDAGNQILILFVHDKISKDTYEEF